jgi:hypothetical protein
MTPADEEALRRDSEVAACVPYRGRFVSPLPRRTRLRLWLTGRVDDAAYWLVCQGHNRAAMRLWKVTGLW